MILSIIVLLHIINVVMIFVLFHFMIHIFMTNHCKSFLFIRNVMYHASPLCALLTGLAFGLQKGQKVIIVWVIQVVATTFLLYIKKNMIPRFSF